jgi:outer membrane protein OmpA-like peptidoglycan-associated protein
MKKLLILAFICLVYNNMSSQSKSKAEKLFDMENYHSVIENLKSKEKESSLTLNECELMGLAFYYNNDFVSAHPYFEKLSGTELFSNQNKFYYSHCLKAVGNKVLAKKILKAYYDESKINNDNGFEDIEALVRLGDRFIIENYEKINSEYSDIFCLDFNDDIYFSSTRPGLLEITKYKWNNQPYLDNYLYSSKRNTVDILTDLNTNVHDSDISINKYNGDIYFTSSKLDEDVFLKKNETIQTKIFEAKIKDGKLIKLTCLSFNSNSYSCKSPFIDADNNRLYFSSNKDGGVGGFDIYYVNLDSPGVIVNLGEQINTLNDEDNFFIDQSKNIYFSSNGYVGFGGKDIFTRIYDQEKNEYKRVMNVGIPVNSNADDFGYKNIGEKGYFTSNRSGGKGDDDIYSFTVTKPLGLDKIHQTLKGSIIDAKTKKTIPNAIITFTEENENLKNVTDKKGRYSLDILGEKKYQVKISADTYKDTTFVYSTTSVKYDIIHKDFLLFSDICKQIYKGKIKDDTNQKLLSQAEIQIIDVNTQKILNTIAAGENGEYYFYVPCDKNIMVKVSFETDGKPYYAQYQEYITTGTEWNKEFEKDISLKPVNSKGLISDKNGNILIPTNPIYFEYNAAKIQSKSFPDLNKVLQYLKENPDWKLNIESHSDIRGSEEYNLKLSFKRAEETKKYFVLKGIGKDRIYTNGLGKTRPHIDCSSRECSETEHAVNRRSDFIIK